MQVVRLAILWINSGKKKDEKGPNKVYKPNYGSKITHNTVQKSVIHRRIEPSAIAQFHQLHYGIQHNLLIGSFKQKQKKLETKMRKKKYGKITLNLTDSQGFFALRRRDDIDKSFNEFIELGTKPGPVDRIGIGFGVNGAV